MNKSDYEMELKHSIVTNESVLAGAVGDKRVMSLTNWKTATTISPALCRCLVNVCNGWEHAIIVDAAVDPMTPSRSASVRFLLVGSEQLIQY